MFRCQERMLGEIRWPSTTHQYSGLLVAATQSEQAKNRKFNDMCKETTFTSSLQLSRPKAHLDQAYFDSLLVFVTAHRIS